MNDSPRNYDGSLKCDNGVEYFDDGLENYNEILTVRALMHGKEVGSIIGKGGDLVRQLRDESGAKIYISDSTVADRIVTVTGDLTAIYKAYELIVSKIGEYFQRQHGNLDGSRPPLTLKLIVPAVQCGAIIGKSGAKIKQLREQTKADIQVSSHMLANSTERTVTIVGLPECVVQCVYQVCSILKELPPPRGNVIPYDPRKGQQSSLLAGLQDNLGLAERLSTANPLASLMSLGGLGGLSNLTVGGTASGVGGINTAAVAAFAASQLRGINGGGKRVPNTYTQEIKVPNEYIGLIIGKRGCKIEEIRQSSGANIRISNDDETVETDEGIMRPITITGTPEAVTVAKCLINMRIDLQKVNLEAQKSSNSDESQSGHPSRSTSPIAHLLSKPAAALTTLSNLTVLSGLSELLENTQNYSHPVQTTGVNHSKPLGSRFHNAAGEKPKNDKNKFSPY